MFIYPTDLNHRITQINQFSYISTEFLYLYIQICCHGYIINNNNHHGFFICIYIYIYICPPIFIIHMYISIYLFVFSSISTVDRPSRSQCVFNRLPHAASHDQRCITFCNTIMRFNQSKKFDIFISNVFYIVVYNCNT